MAKTWLTEVKRLMPWFTDEQLIHKKCPYVFFPWMKSCGHRNNDTSKCAGCWNSPYVERSENDETD